MIERKYISLYNESVKDKRSSCMERKLPAYPIFVKDPNFSFWSTSDVLNDTDITSWCGEKKPMYGLLRLSDGEVWCFMGDIDNIDGKNVKKAKQKEVIVSSFATTYIFEAGFVELTVKFVSPLPPDDVERISEPVCYMSYSLNKDIEGTEVSLFISRRIAYDSNPKLPVNDTCRNYAYNVGKDRAAFIGLKRQLYLSNNEDWAGADWGYWYVCGKDAAALDCYDFERYILTGKKDFSNVDEEKFIAAFETGKEGFITLAYDSIVAIDYFGDFKKTLYLENHTIIDAIKGVRENKDKIEARLDEIDEKLKIKADKISPDYYDILAASLRQSVAAHTAIADNDKKVVFLSKENGSNGCIGTLDVSYPSMPLYLIYNTELVKGMLRPILKFARMPIWKFDFTPHDVGAYPFCCGNVYGAVETGRYGSIIKNKCGELQPQYYLFPENDGEIDEDMQMPVEECANMLIMLYACYAFDGDITLYADNADLCEKWVRYLVKYGLKPANQLCSDDFAGHFSNNLNLAIKAAVGIGCYAKLLEESGSDGKEFEKTAKEFATEIENFSENLTHLPLTWDGKKEGFGIKYNLLFDKVLDLNLFSRNLREKETDFYIEKSLPFGIPFFDIKNYVKSDWAIWVAALTDDSEKRKKMTAPIANFLKNSPSRVPFCDWYMGDTGEKLFSQARSVVGGCFALLLADALREK